MSSNFVIVIITILMIVCIDAIFYYVSKIKHAPKKILITMVAFFDSIFLVFLFIIAILEIGAMVDTGQLFV